MYTVRQSPRSFFYVHICSQESFAGHQFVKLKLSIAHPNGQGIDLMLVLCQTRQIWGIWKLRPSYSPETPNLGQNRWFLSRVTLKFDGWPWKTIGHLSFAVSSFVQHFIAIGELKLELLSGNAQSGSNSTIFRAVWPWNLTYDLEKE